MRKLALASLICVLFLGGITKAHAADAYGLWLTENKRSVIKVEPCGTKLCGHIQWIIEGGMQHDTKNPQENLKGQPMCGLQIMQGFVQNKNNANEWQDGKIYKADEGDIYNATIKMTSADEMVVRGYVGIPLLGKSQTWKRVNAQDYPTCKSPK